MSSKKSSKKTEDSKAIISEMIAKGYIIQCQDGKFSFMKEPGREEREVIREFFKFGLTNQTVGRFEKAFNE